MYDSRSSHTNDSILKFDILDSETLPAETRGTGTGGDMVTTAVMRNGITRPNVRTNRSDRSNKREQEPARASTHVSTSASILGWQHCLMASLHVSVEEHRFLGRPDAVRPRTCGSPTVDAQISAAAFNGLRSRERAASTEQQKERLRRAPAACGMGAWVAEMQMPCSCSCMSEAGNGVRSNAGGQGAELRELGGWGGCLAPLLRLAQSVPIAV